MYFDPSRNAYIDEETGEVVFHENEASTAQSSAPARTRGGLFSSFTTPTRSRMHTQYTPTSQDIEMASYQDVIHENDKDELVITKLDEFERLFELAAEERQQSTSTHKKKKEHHQKEDNVNALEQQLYNLHVTNSYDEVLRSPVNTANESHTDLEGITIPPENDEHINDWNFARTLQMLEFEITNEGIENDEYGDFNGKEYRASRSCRRQLATISFVICIVQIALLIAMCEVDGQASYAENPTIGPPAYSMVRFGAKEAALIVYKHEWWRLFSSTMLHAGVYHIIPNVAIQLRVGGYLNLVYGTPRWLWIYVISGIYGEMCSCLFIPDSVGVGSSGALMGMLSSWVVWIIFRWKKIPPECKSQRNCQLAVVVGSIVITLATSFMPRVDWAAHAGGALMGAIWGVILLSSELDISRNGWYLRISAFILFAVLFSYSLYYMIAKLHPTKAYLEYWEDNDDWP